MPFLNLSLLLALGVLHSELPLKKQPNNQDQFLGSKSRALIKLELAFMEYVGNTACSLIK